MFPTNPYLYHLPTIEKIELFEEKRNFLTNTTESDSPAVTFLRNRSIEVLLFNVDSSSN